MSELHKKAEELAKECVRLKIDKNQFRNLFAWSKKGKEEFDSYIKYQTGRCQLSSVKPYGREQRLSEQLNKEILDTFEKILKGSEDDSEFIELINIAIRYFTYYSKFERR